MISLRAENVLKLFIFFCFVDIFPSGTLKCDPVIQNRS